MFVPPHFAGTDQEAVRFTSNLLAQRGIPIRVCWEGDCFQLSPGVTARVLHPPVEFGGSDNEQSLVLCIEYLGKRVLLPGDVEGAGLRRLLASKPTQVNALVAPHHGSRGANTPDVAEWAGPDVVVVSRGRRRFGGTLHAYHQRRIPVLITDQRGAISLRIDEAGLHVQTFR